YFAAGGLRGSAWVNSAQLFVMIIGFAIALPPAVSHAGGRAAMTSGPGLPTGFGSLGYSSGPGSGWTLLLLVGPAFIVSPGLIQKSYGARSERALMTGVGLSALALMVFAFGPVLLGMAARALHPGITDANAVLPTLLTS